MGMNDELIARIREQQAEIRPPYLFPQNKDLIFPGMSRTTCGMVVEDVWSCAFNAAVKAVQEHGGDGGDGGAAVKHGLMICTMHNGQVVGCRCWCGQEFPDQQMLQAHAGAAMPSTGGASAADALRLAVDLHSSHRLVLDEARVLRRQAVLDDAEAFYEWLLEKGEGR